MDIPGVPEKITRAAYIALIESLGLDTEQLRKLEFGYDSVTAEVYALNSEGNRYPDTTPGREGDIALHRLVIRIE